MPRRYWVQTSDSKITGLTDIDTVAVPDDHTAVLETVIRVSDPPGADGRIQAGGKWDGAHYTPPEGGGVLAAYDDSTELGRRKIAATKLHDYLQNTTAGIHAVRHEKPTKDTGVAEQFIAMAHWANYVAFSMSTIDIDAFEAWVEAMMEGAADFTTVQEFFEKSHTIDDDSVPSEACAWADPTNAVRTLLSEAKGASTGASGFFENETTDLTMVTLGNGEWIREAA